MYNIGNMKLVDVTLRDGGYRNNFSFDMNYILDHARLIQQARIDYLEIGYRNGSAIKYDGMGLTGYADNQYIQTLYRELPGMKLGVIVHAANICDRDIYEMAENGVSLIRFCANDKNMKDTIHLAKIAKNCGLTTAINLTHISSISKDKLKDYIAQVNANVGTFDVVYCADSNGNLTPDLITDLYDQIKEQSSDFELGFHAHDNIGQAMANSIAAIHNDVTFIDASLLGMGKGIGNLRLEQWIAYHQKCGESKYSIMPILKAVDQLRNYRGYVEQKEDYSVDIISGIWNFSFGERDQALNLWQAANQQSVV
jgi:4-hydroxy 2-oxovalerate aldolase